MVCLLEDGNNNKRIVKEILRIPLMKKMVSLQREIDKMKMT